MPGETFVDVTYRGLELGRRHRLFEVGPTTAYLEHPTPMPVGSRLALFADGGIELAVEVVRVHEQVAGAERAPGMRVRAPALDERAASLWRSLISVDDAAVAPAAAPAAAAAAVPHAVDGPDRTAPTRAPTPAVADLADAGDAPDTEVVDVDTTIPQARIPGGRTEVMSAVDIEAITSQAREPGEASGSTPVEAAGKKGRRGNGGGRKKNGKK